MALVVEIDSRQTNCPQQIGRAFRVVETSPQDRDSRFTDLLTDLLTDLGGRHDPRGLGRVLAELPEIPGVNTAPLPFP
jgi:hypothetical protein